MRKLANFFFRILLEYSLLKEFPFVKIRSKSECLLASTHFRVRTLWVFIYRNKIPYDFWSGFYYSLSPKSRSAAQFQNTKSLMKICYFAEENNALDCVAVRLADTTLNHFLNPPVEFDHCWDVLAKTKKGLLEGRQVTLSSSLSALAVLYRCLAAKERAEQKTLLKKFPKLWNQRLLKEGDKASLSPPLPRPKPVWMLAFSW